MVIPFLLGLKHSFLRLLGILVANCSLTSPTPRTVYQMLGMVVPNLALLPQSKTTLKGYLSPRIPSRIHWSLLCSPDSLSAYSAPHRCRPRAFPKSHFLTANLSLRLCYSGIKITNLPEMDTSSAVLMQLSLLQFWDSLTGTWKS